MKNQSLWTFLSLLNTFSDFSHIVILKKYSGDSERSISFDPSFKIILKLVECFSMCAKSEKVFRRLRKVHKLCNFIQNHSEACTIFTPYSKSKKKLRELSMTCNNSRYTLRTLRKCCTVCNVLIVF